MLGGPAPRSPKDSESDFGSEWYNMPSDHLVGKTVPHEPCMRRHISTLRRWM